VQRIPEPELMDDEAQALAYASADFAEAHDRFVALFRETFPAWRTGCVLDLGCGPADVTLRFARAYARCTVHGVDGAAAMLNLGMQAIVAAGCRDRIALIQGYLPGARLPRTHYDAVISNSLLHHLADPAVLWQAILAHAPSGAPVFVMDLMRPASAAEARGLVQRYTATEPEVLRHDFYQSLLAAYRPEELVLQLREAGLEQFQVQAVSDRHLTVSGVMP
jgi:SAM-dependent methyltransferase